MGIIEALKQTFRVKMMEELKERADKGESTVGDAMAALMLAATMEGERENLKKIINKHE